MTIGSPRSQRAGGTRQDVSGAVTAALMRYVRGRVGDEGVRQMLAFAGERRSVDELQDVTGWSTHDEAVSLFGAATLVTGDNAVGLHIGEEMLLERDGSGVADRLRALGSPTALLENVTAAMAKFNTVSITEALEVGEAHAVVRAVTRPGFTRHVQLCDFTRGVLSQVPVLFGLVPALVTESECQARGGRFCLYSVAWEARQWRTFVDDRTSLYSAAWGDDRVDEMRPELDLDDDTRIGQLKAQLAHMGERLDDVFSTAAELLSDQDITTLLDRITTRAAHAVSAPRHLLVVRTAPDAPVQLHHHGFELADAQALANELWREHPDDAGGSRLIVDVASSRRRYGRLAAVYPPGSQFFESERRILGLYAGYAATALDVVTSLEEARRSDATARALLDFSRALSGATTTADVAQNLADAVPRVLDCSHASVLLWDDERAELVLRARTAGVVLPASWNGPAERPGIALRPSDTPILDQIRSQHDILELDSSDTDPIVIGLLERAGVAKTLLAPLMAGDEFLGVVAANFRAPHSAVQNAEQDLRSRLGGIADLSVTAFQNTKLLERISHMAWHDDLTGLPNRRLLEDRVSQELVRARRVGEGVCMFFVDLDRFKNVNDTYGHAAGDELIRQVAERLCATVRRQDTVARLGGDEFAVLLPGLTDRNAVEHLARRSLEALHAPYQIGERDVRASASIGIALTPDHGDTFDELLSRADEAMYRSKRKGRDTFQLFDESEPSGPGSLDLETEIPRALDQGEFFVLYQPYIDLQTTQVVGVEALVRWRHPTRGVLEPEAFIPAVEGSEAIVALDAWVLRQGCEQLARWAAAGLPRLRLSVNVASRDLADPSLLESVQKTLADTGVDPTSIELEITERVVLDTSGMARANVEGLRSLGVRFSIDDFGAGRSALDRIGSFPVSTLKIDRSFVQVLGPEGESSGLVSAIVTMAQRLGLDCMAEGVETSHQSRVLLQRGCTTAQGFFFSPPLLPNDVERMLVDRAGGRGQMPGLASGTAS